MRVSSESFELDIALALTVLSRECVASSLSVVSPVQLGIKEVETRRLLTAVSESGGCRWRQVEVKIS